MTKKEIFKRFCDLKEDEQACLRHIFAPSVYEMIRTLKAGSICLDNAISYALYPNKSTFGQKTADHKALRKVLKDIFPFIIA